jgi:hypothetical protein
MGCLNVLRMVVSPGPSHPFRVLVVRYDVAIFGKFLVADCAFAALLGDFPVQQLPHLGRRSEFAISPWVVRILDALNAEP